MLLLVAAAGLGGGMLYASLSRTAAVNALHRGENSQGAPTRVVYGATRAAIIGDSWASGYGLADPTGSFAYHLASLQEWDVTVNAVNSTGFAAGGAGSRGLSYASRARFLPVDAQIVVIEGGLNDVDALDHLEERTDIALRAVRDRVPDAKVVVVGPPNVPFHEEEHLRRVDKILDAASKAAGLRYISTLTWEVETFDDLHPTAQAHRAFAERLNGELDSS